MINNNPSQMMPVQQSFSSRTRQQIDSSHYRRRLMAAIGNSNEEARINLVSGNPSRLLMRGMNEANTNRRHHQPDL